MLWLIKKKKKKKKVSLAGRNIETFLWFRLILQVRRVLAHIRLCFRGRSLELSSREQRGFKSPGEQGMSGEPSQNWLMSLNSTPGSLQGMELQRAATWSCGLLQSGISYLWLANARCSIAVCVMQGVSNLLGYWGYTKSKFMAKTTTIL